MTRSELEREHQARTLGHGHHAEPRISRADEQQIADDCAHAAKHALRTELANRLQAADQALAQIDRIIAAYPRVVAGDHRSRLRAVTDHQRRLRTHLGALREQI